jgi:hypothetical protein
MKKRHNMLIAGIIVALLAALFYMLSASNEDSSGASSSTVSAVKATIQNIDLAYPTTYAVYEKRNTGIVKNQHTVVWYKDIEANRAFFRGEPGAQTEPPVTMSLDIYSNPNSLSGRELLLKDAPYMFSKPAGTLLVGGQTGELYEWEGLYKGRSIMINHKGDMYVFSITSLGTNDPIINDFTILLNSVTFK